MKTIITLFSILFFFQSHLFSQSYDDYLGAGNQNGITVTSSDPSSSAEETINGAGLELDIQGASRFLAHATLGATMEDIQYTTEVGIDVWIDEQMNLEPSYHTALTLEILFDFYDRCKEANPLCDQMFTVDTRYWRFAWWHNLMNGEDLLRQRVALALSEILVVSDQSQLRTIPHGLAYYYDILSRHAFGNYEDLLLDITLSPAMGVYLSHLNNPKSIPALNITPDENYAREVMQLFTIGLYELNQNGERKIDMSTGLWIPTYDNEDISEMAKIFTGLSGSKWANEELSDPVRFGLRFNAYSFIDPLAMYEEWHEPGQKILLKDEVVPAGQTGMRDIEQAISYLFNHENVGPFLARRLIQQLVKSNPSQDYISRISAVFADNGSGVRGDLGAVVKAILTDTEAIECYWIDNYSNGKLRSPMMRYTQLMKGLKAESRSEWFLNAGSTFQTFTEQHVLSSPTVFNFYQPDFVPNADFAYDELVGPEYQILNSATSSNYVNYMLLAIMNDYIKEDLPSPNLQYGYLNDAFRNVIQYTSNISDYVARLSDEKWLSLADYPYEMVDYLDILLTNGQLDEERKDQIAQSVGQRNILDARDAAHYAAFLIMIDPDYVVMK